MVQIEVSVAIYSDPTSLCLAAQFPCQVIFDPLLEMFPVKLIQCACSERGTRSRVWMAQEIRILFQHLIDYHVQLRIEICVVGPALAISNVSLLVGHYSQLNLVFIRLFLWF
jgi:hypothetical protein